MQQTILVTGGTGKVGREVVRSLLDVEGFRVRAGTRDPALARSLRGLDVEVVELDFYRTETFDAAVEGVDRLFLQAPPADPDAYETLAPLLDWGVQAGIDRIVNLSAMAVEELEELAIRKVENHVASLDIAYTFLRPNLYMQNFHPGFLSREIREEGRFSLPLGDARVSWVDVRDVAAVAAAALTGAGHEEAAYTLTGPEAVAPGGVAEILSDVAGRAIEYNSAPEEEMREILREAGWSASQAEVMLGLFGSVREGARAAVSGDVERILGRPATSLRSYAEAHADAWS